MKINRMIGVSVALMVALLAGTAAAQSLDNFWTTRVLSMSAGQTIAANAVFTTNGPFNLAGYAGRSILIASAQTNVPGGTTAFKLEFSTDSTNWNSVSNFATALSLTPVVVTNYSVESGGLLYLQTNLWTTNQYLLPYTPSYPSAPLAGYNTVANLPESQFTNAAGYTTVPPNGQPVLYSLKSADYGPYYHIIWNVTGNATNGVSPSNAVVNAVWIGSRMWAP